MVDKKLLENINDTKYIRTKIEMIKELKEVENLVIKLKSYFSEETLHDLNETVENAKEEINNIKGRWLAFCDPRWDCDGYDLCPAKYIKEEDKCTSYEYSPIAICNSKEEAESALRKVK